MTTLTTINFDSFKFISFFPGKKKTVSIWSFGTFSTEKIQMANWFHFKCPFSLTQCLAHWTDWKAMLKLSRKACHDQFSVEEVMLQGWSIFWFWWRVCFTSLTLYFSSCFIGFLTKEAITKMSQCLFHMIHIISLQNNSIWDINTIVPNLPIRKMRYWKF